MSPSTIPALTPAPGSAGLLRRFIELFNRSVNSAITPRWVVVALVVQDDAAGEALQRVVRTKG